jgi:hypothetical protein
MDKGNIEENHSFIPIYSIKLCEEGKKKIGKEDLNICKQSCLFCNIYKDDDIDMAIIH